uniref:CCR4-NOT transcription complex subunit 3 n=1 Tax=Leptocylindrus danicus TaxID=163516 RepID=A0A7S2PIB4_9STRA|mmetsp:Transcript_3434/g.4997  ORF Transcript_3434/g.4997 Transcript_3434/m.4997 type:complete len:658 (+) Transcript_3434:66-2039(+)
MSGARKLQTEIDRVMKKVDEGVLLFDDIWEKVYNAEQQNQKEKHEMDLKKEIKKLQRLRDQIKSWIGSSDVKDKDPLIDARKRIETKMEQFKICEKETKTKTYSKEGLLRQEKLDPREEEKQKTTTWIQAMIDQMQALIDECDLEIERLSSGKGKKTNRHKIEDLNVVMTNHKFHITKLEGIMRLVNNDRLEVDVVNDLQEDLEVYIESHEDDDYMMCYDEEMFYEQLGLEDMDVVTVDRVTNVDKSSSKKSKDDDSSAHSGSAKGSKDSRESKKKKSSSSTPMIPLTIGRATVRSSSKSSTTDKDEKELKSSAVTTPTKASNTGIPTPVSAHKTPQPPAGASMASILKRETEMKEKERQVKAAQQAALQQQQQQQQQQQLLREQQARAQQEQLRQKQAQLQRQQEAMRLQQQQQEALKRQQQMQEQQARQAKEVAVAQQQAQLQQQAAQRGPSGPGALESLLTSGLGSLSLGTNTTQDPTSAGSNASSPLHSATTAVSQPSQQVPVPTNASYDPSSYMGLLNDSFLHCPSLADSERQRTYVPSNPYPVPSSYPNAPSPIFENPAIFEKLGTDCLFFIFYYAQGTYQQYLAARQLKKQNWRYHKKYMTWFQRHEEPKITTDEYEQGTYVYFDYETGWCKRLKSDFRFEYSFLEDSLV